MKRWLAVFELTLAEQRVVLALLLIIVAVVAIKSRAEKRDQENAGAVETFAQPSPSPGIRP